LTLTEQISNVETFGYTAREAAFLVTAALHSGYFVMRQIAPKGGTVAERFGRRVLALGHARVTKCASNTGLYHLSGKSLWRALEQENNRHRRAHSAFHIRAKVMGLDYVLHHSGSRFLPTEEAKLSYFADELKLPNSLFPIRTYAGKEGTTERFFVDKYPLRIDPATGRTAFCFVDDGAFGELGFDTWLAQYDALIGAVKGSEVVFVSANPSRFDSALRTAGRHFSSSSLGSDPAELLAYFELRKGVETSGLRGRSQAEMDTWKRLRKTYGGSEFETQYTAWLTGASVATAPAVTVSTYHLPYSYGFAAGAVA